MKKKITWVIKKCTSIKRKSYPHIFFNHRDANRFVIYLQHRRKIASHYADALRQQIEVRQVMTTEIQYDAAHCKTYESVERRQSTIDEIAVQLSARP